MPGATFVTEAADAWQHVDPGAASVPARYLASVDGVDPGSWLGLAVDGTIAGTGPTFVHRDGRPVVDVMVDPALLTAGDVDIDLVLIDAAGRIIGRLLPG